MAIRITAIRLSGGTGYEHIEHLWWTSAETGDGNSSTTATIVEWIEQGGHAFVQEPGTKPATVAVVATDHGSKYLRTHADGQWNNNLLALPRR